MSKTTKFLGLAVLSMTLAAGPVISAYAAGSDPDVDLAVRLRRGHLGDAHVADTVQALV